MESNVYFLYETWFFHFFHGLFLAKISVYDSLRFQSKYIATSFVFLLGKSGFPIGYAFFCISAKKILPALFLWDIGGNNGFSLKNSGGQPQFSTEFLQQRHIGGS